MSSPSKQTAFALIELVLAIGVAAFALAAIVGLFAIGVDSSRESSDDTVLAAVTNEIFGELRAEDFEQLLARSGGSARVTGNPVPLTLPGRYYDGSGLRLVQNGQDVAASDPLFAEAAYRCEVTLEGDIDTLSAIPQGSNATPNTTDRDINLLRVTLSFQPARAGNRGTETKVFYGTVARY